MNKPKVDSVKLHGGGQWLNIDVSNIGIASEVNIYGDFCTGSVEFRGITKEFARNLRDKLITICETWEVSSGTPCLKDE